jgi:hypothetical protein
LARPDEDSQAKDLIVFTREDHTRSGEDNRSRSDKVPAAKPFAIVHCLFTALLARRHPGERGHNSESAEI